MGWIYRTVVQSSHDADTKLAQSLLGYLQSVVPNGFDSLLSLQGNKVPSTTVTTHSKQPCT